MAATDPFVLNADGTAKDPVAFREALKADPAKMEALEKEPDVAAIVLGEDVSAFQELIKSIYQARGKGFWAAGMARRAAEKKRLEKHNKGLAERTIDAQRVSATIPRDTVQLYQQLRESGLQYGPAFRLLRNVHVPAMVDEA
ncbi:hypothetical protein CHLNCDRAFT_142650 [Chlorella variabilis]|uniref:Uncharacterized protein n=1 Tax=Chlorella variabilis TaxID=554065 RepID=E1ZU10_CHLVA|nr:hypothetical protein CHLNCDRAFT_142650 [Chlorella variabilis]EFN50684.1 hypothetical protein CHLNCDRAFT_142650 [Chlorella variabilis]|eukprot:XP_005842796.1 hypothetical protein CHLNCDRAFT_142650 [Chlorella variabilis]